MSARPPSLLRIVAGRVLLFGAAAMLVQLIVVCVSYWQDDELLGRGLIAQETERFSEGLSLKGDRLVFDLPADLGARYLAGATPSDASAGTPPADSKVIADGYYARLRTPAGEVLYSNCEGECAAHFLPLTLNPPTFWERVIRPGKPLVFAGGRTISVADRLVHIEIAVVGDPDFLVGGVLAEEIREHMIVPMTLMLTIIFGATILSIRKALQPVSRAAASVADIDPTDPAARIGTDGMPAEIEHFASAVNRGISRVGALIRAQRLFTSAIAHEIRTPLAAATLELERSGDPAALRARADLSSIAHILGQLTSLARLETIEASAFVSVALPALAEDVIGRLAPAIYEQGRSIALHDRGAEAVRGAPTLLESLLRNLIENAARHTPTGTAITVTVGPGRQVTVADDGPGFDLAAARASAKDGRLSGGMGIGLEIVEKVVALHGARIEWALARPGTLVTVSFP